jgi:succinyl-CoA synthetase beta subunit
MKIHEHQAKELFSEAGIPVPTGKVAFTVDEARSAAQELFNKGNSLVVVKAQIHAGGRGKAGGVKLARSVDEAAQCAREILGKKLITPQTSAEGQEVRRLWVEAGSQIEKEFYLSAIVDRKSQSISVLASAEGGMDIEELAHTHPEKILNFSLDTISGPKLFHGRKLSQFLGLGETHTKECSSFLTKIYEFFWKWDASMVEVNPLALVKTPEGSKLMALDAKVNFDENALFRHPKLKELFDPFEVDLKELEASKYDLNFIALDGSIGCMVNGAGLAMATMDIVQVYGGSPANFLDVGGGADATKVREAFKIILSDPKVKAIFVNIFGGIMKCDVIAEGIISASKEVQLKVPLVVRLEGTNVEKGREMLQTSGLKIETAASMAEGAEKVVRAAKAGA